jgi:type VII secretion-associated serine protease mycosin
VQNKVWPITEGKGVTVGLLDSGVDAKLPELSQGVVPGANYVSGSGDGRTDADPSRNGHGTAMATLIAANGKGSGMVGVAPAAKILPVAVDDAASIAKGIRFATDHGAKVINISQGSPYDKCPADLQNAVSYAVEKDVVIVAAAGNSGDTNNPPETPANCAGVFAIGAVDSRLKAWSGTQKQDYVAAAAPGVNIALVASGGRQGVSRGGTSPAAALTSAAVALVRSKFPDMSARDVVQRIIFTARDAGPAGHDEQTGYGIVRPYNALTVASVPKDAPNPVFAAYDKWKTPQGGAQQQSPTPAHTKDAGELARDKQSQDAKRNTKFLLIGGPIAFLVLVGVVILFTRRKKPAAPTGPGFGGPPYNGPQQPPGPYIQPPGNNDQYRS